MTYRDDEPEGPADYMDLAPYGEHKQPPRRDEADPWPDFRREYWESE